MTKKKAQKIYVSKLVVEGRRHFPIDMLRYDGCAPWNEDDSASIKHCDERSMLSSDPVRITLRRTCPNDRGAAVGRWQSFGWAVIEETPLAAWSS